MSEQKDRECCTWDDLVQDDEDGRFYRDTVSCSGIVCEYYADGSNRAETQLNDGRQVFERAWYESGNLSFERSMMGECLHGECREWHSDGQLKRISKYEFGVCLQSVEWDENGTETARSVLQEGSANHELLQRLRTKWDRIHGASRQSH